MSIKTKGRGISEEGVEVMIAFIEELTYEIITLRRIVRWLTAIALAGLITIGVLIW